MKVSQEQKEETRLKLIASAVEIISEKGFRATTMKAIAQKAEVGIATIYNYFPNKDKILYAYFEDKYLSLGAQLESIEGFDEFELNEQIQTLIETLLENFLEDREFVEEAAYLAIFSPLTSFNDSKQSRDIFLDIAKNIWNKQLKKANSPTPITQDWMLLMFWEYYLGIVAYWLKDESPNFNHTTQLIDKTSEIIKMTLENDFIGKFMDLGTFLYRTHFHSYMANFQPKEK
jgi:AcrR family transcriptional regulator